MRRHEEDRIDDATAATDRQHVEQRDAARRGRSGMKAPAVFAICLVLAWLGHAGDAMAYLDPGTGSMILQGIIGVVAAGAAMVGIYWQKIKTYFKKEAARDTDKDNGTRDGR